MMNFDAACEVKAFGTKRTKNQSNADDCKEALL